MKKCRGFTLAELLICLTIIGAMATIMMANLKTENFTEKSDIASASKALINLQQASIKIRELESDKCPTGKFMTKVLGTWEYTILNKKDGSVANATEILGMYGDYLKYQSTNLNFCSYTGYCAASNTNIKSAKVAGNMYIGFEVYSAISNCPTTYYMPNNPTAVTKTAAQAGKCWGNFWVDTNGLNAPNTLGKDVFVWGLGEDGASY